jgi:hypothetical protein
MEFVLAEFIALVIAGVWILIGGTAGGVIATGLIVGHLVVWLGVLVITSDFDWFD